MAASKVKFLYESIWCRFGCPIELVSDQGTHFINKIVHELSTYYAVVHKKKHSLLSASKWISRVDKQNPVDNTQEDSKLESYILGSKAS